MVASWDCTRATPPLGFLDVDIFELAREERGPVRRDSPAGRAPSRRA